MTRVGRFSAKSLSAWFGFNYFQIRTACQTILVQNRNLAAFCQQSAANDYKDGSNGVRELSDRCSAKRKCSGSFEGQIAGNDFAEAIAGGEQAKRQKAPRLVEARGRMADHLADRFA